MFTLPSYNIHLRAWLHAALCLALVGLSALIGTQTTYATPPPMVDGQPVRSLAPMLAKVTPAVVNISSKSHVEVRDPFFDDPVFRHFFGGQPDKRIQQSLGSGVIIDADKGYILTNHHVIADADSIKVTLHDGRDFKAEIVGTDPDTDLALIKIDAKHLDALPFSDSRTLKVGDFVAAVGNPFGLGQSVTYGIVSALGRTGLGDTYQNFIQTDTAINPGNSGGALVNLDGELVGINSMIYSPSGASAGISFAIPSHLAEQIVDQLLAHGEVKRGNLGLDVQAIDEAMTRALKLGAIKGVLVRSVANHSSAQQAGIHAGDVIISMNGEKVRTPKQLENMQGLLPVGSKVSLKIWRQGKTRKVTAHIQSEVLAEAEGKDLDPRLAGAHLRDTSKNDRQHSYQGVQVLRVDANSPAARSGLEKNDMILAVNQQRTRNIAMLAHLTSKPRAHQLMLIIMREGQRYYLLMH